MKKGIILFAMLLCLFSCKKTVTLKEYGGLYYEVEITSKNQSKEMIDETVKILKNRIEGNCTFNPVVEYDPIKKIISIQLPLESDSLLYNDLITTQGKFSVCEVANNNDINKYLTQIDSFLVKKKKIGISVNDIALQSGKKTTSSIQLYTPKDNVEPVLYIHPNYIMGILIYFKDNGVKQILPPNITFKFGKFLAGDFMQLYTLKTINENTTITNIMIEDTKVGERILDSHPISIQLNKKYYDKWDQLTKENAGKNLALVLDNEVICSVKVNSEITDGKMGLLSKLDFNKTTMLSNILKYGNIKSDLRITKFEKIKPY